MPAQRFCLMASSFLLPGEGLEFGHGLGVGPGLAAAGVDDERDAGEDNGADDEDAHIHRRAAHGNLAGRNEAEDERQQTAQHAQATDNPHAEGLAAGNAEETGVGKHTLLLPLLSVRQSRL